MLNSYNYIFQSCPTCVLATVVFILNNWKVAKMDTFAEVSIVESLLYKYRWKADTNELER